MASPVGRILVPPANADPVGCEGLAGPANERCLLGVSLGDWNAAACESAATISLGANGDGGTPSNLSAFISVDAKRSAG